MLYHNILIFMIIIQEWVKNDTKNDKQDAHKKCVDC